MKSSESNNNKVDFPEDLLYSEENWIKALELIESHDKKVFNYNFFKGLLIIALLIGSIFTYINYNTSGKNTDNKTLSNDLQNMESDISSNKNIKTNTQHNNDVNLKNNSTSNIGTSLSEQADNITHTKPSQGGESNDIINESIFLANKKRETSNNMTPDTVISSQIVKHNSKSNMSANTTILVNNIDKQSTSKTKPFEYIDSMNKSNIHNNNEYNVFQNNKRSNNNFNTPALVDPLITSSITLQKNTLSNMTGIRSISNSIESVPFSFPKKSLSIKIGSSPWVEYGKNNNWSGWNMSYGIEFDRNFNSKTTLTYGLGYFTISSIPLVLERSETSYGYGLESITTTIETNEMDFVYFPICINYRVKKRVQLSIGSGVSYLINTSNTLHKTKHTNTESNLLNSQNTNGYFQGYRRLTMFSSLGVNYWFIKNMSLEASFQLGMSDFTIDKEFNEEKTHSNSKLSISIKRIIR